MRRIIFLTALTAATPALAQNYNEPGTSDTFGNTTLGITDSGRTYETQQFGGTTYYQDSSGRYTTSYTNGDHTVTQQNSLR